MRTETISVIRNQSIFTPENSSARPKPRSVAWHNIQEMHKSLSPDQVAQETQRYLYRGGALAYGAGRIGLYVPEPTDAIRRHTEYLGAVMGRDFPVLNMGELNKMKGKPDTLVVPYINTPDTQTSIHELGQEPWGLPPEMVSALKNKVSFHELIEDFGIEGLETPDYLIVNLKDIPKKANSILKDAEALYEKHDLSSYPRGVVIRAEDADGGYGTSLVFQEDDGRIVVIPEGKEEEKEYFRQNEWTKAFKFAQKRQEVSASNKGNPRFVISRRIDIEDSPGMSIIMKHGYFESIGWNGQELAKGTKSCIGTSRYSPTGRYLEGLQKQHEDESAEAFAALLRETAKRLNIPFEKITGVINMDLMIPGPYESTLRSKRGQGSGYYLAECNARWTNYTDAIMAVVGFNGRVPSFREIQRTAWEQVHTIDKKSLNGADPEAVREVLFDIDEIARREGDSSRAFMRIPGVWPNPKPDQPDDPSGFIFTGNRERAERKVETAIEVVKNPRERIIYLA